VHDDGHLGEHGSHHELIAAEGRYAELFTLQAAAYREHEART
jgi:ABC-type multidrug transport system fused ATPase/permease subunit